VESIPFQRYNARIVKLKLQEKRILNTQQKRAVHFGDGPLLIIAGAGTGKTTVIAERIKYLVQSKRAKPEKILALTFTEKATKEMEDRIDKVMPYGVTQMWISTFHSFCDRVLKSECMAIGLDPNYHLMSQAETIQFFRRHIFDFPLNYFRPLGNPTKFVTGMIDHISRLKDEDIHVDRYTQWAQDGVKKAHSEEEVEEAEKFQELASLYRAYETIKIKEGVMDYGDLLSNTLTLFRSRPSILVRYREQFTHILVDEFQDTNYSQNELAVMLAGKEKNITVVGDDDQAIFRWRGAAVSNIIQFRQTFPDVTIVVLTKNYRSTQEILRRSYDLIKNNNPDRLEVVEKIKKKLICTRKIKGKSISFIHTQRVEDEADTVVQEIQTLISADSPHYHPKDVAILVRANAHADPFIRSLSRRGIPYQFLGPGQLLRQPEVKDLLSYLTLLSDIGDSVACFRVLSMDHLKIPSRDIATLSSHAQKNGISLFETCEQSLGVHPAGACINLPLSPVGKDSLKKIIDIIQYHLGLIKNETAGQILYFFLEKTGLLREYTSINTVKSEKEALNVSKFFDKIKSYEVDHDDAGVFAVVEWLTLSMEIGESPRAGDIDWLGRDAVNILTVHSAKGLEFPVVFMVNLATGRFPTTEKKEQIPIPDALIRDILPSGDPHIQEERRLFYVGMTRARDLLYFSVSDYYGEGKRAKKPSQFISEALTNSIHIEAVAAESTKEHQMSLLDWAKPMNKDAIQLSENTKPVISYLSYSQIETFITCPLQYKYRYILKIPVPQAAALSFGQAIHTSLEKLYESLKDGTPMNKTELLGQFRKDWSASYRNKKYEYKMIERGAFLLSEYYEKVFVTTTQVLSLEAPFKIRIHPELSIGGKIDRIDKTASGIEIIDYKTGSAPKKRDPAKDLQLSVYALAATENAAFTKNIEEVTVSLLFLDGLEKVSANRTQENLDHTKQEIHSIANTIAASDFAPTPGKFCDFCEFRLLCDAWR